MTSVNADKKMEEPYIMKRVTAFLTVVACTVVVGCAGQLSQERALQDFEKQHEQSAEEIILLQQAVEEKQAEVAQLLEKNQDLQQNMDMREAAVAQLQKQNQDLKQAIDKQVSIVAQLQENQRELEHAIEVQDQLQEQHLAAAKQELEALYGQILGLKHPSDDQPPVEPIFQNEPLGFDDVTAALQTIRSTLDEQVEDLSRLQTQKRQLEQELSALEARLQEVDRLKNELEQVRRAREVQEAQLAKIKNEVLAVGEEIEFITKTLEEKFGKSLVVTQHPDRLVLTLLGQVLFESGEAELTPLGLQIMKRVGQVLATFSGKSIQIEGHTDNNPIHGQLQRYFPTNWELSTARATTVLRYLIEQTGMDQKQFSATGYADTRPVQTNETEEGRAQNRRVEIVLYPERIIQDSEKLATRSGHR